MAFAHARLAAGRLARNLWHPKRRLAFAAAQCGGARCAPAPRPAL